MNVKIYAIARGTTALASGQIIHFDIAESKKPNPDMRKLEAIVPEADALRIVELGWAAIAKPEEVPATAKANEPSVVKPGDAAGPVNVGPFVVTETGGGWFEITGGNLDKPKKVRGAEAALEAAQKLVGEAALDAMTATSGAAHDPEAGPA